MRKEKITIEEIQIWYKSNYYHEHEHLGVSPASKFREEKKFLKGENEEHEK